MEVSPLKAFILTYLMPEKCYDHFFLQLHFSHGPCLKIVLSKVLALWSLATLLAPLPQIWKMIRGGGSEGLSLVSALLDLLAVSAHVAFCVHHSFPIGAWGESVFVLVQLALVVFLIQHYRGDRLTGGVSLAVYAAFMYLLTSPLTPRAVVKETQEWSVLIVIGSRLIQVGCNHSSGSTGQLSGVCVFLLFMGSLDKCSALYRTLVTLSVLRRMFCPPVVLRCSCCRFCCSGTACRWADRVREGGL